MGIGKLEVGLFSICFWSITSDNLSKGNPFMRIIKFWLLITIAVAFLAGCAHPISVVPPDVVRSSEMPDRIKKKVGVFISPDSLSLEVVTPGGGGDSVSYFPYRDLENGYHKMLGNVFEDVVQVTKPNDPIEFQRGGISYVISPAIITNSGSTSLVGFAPTNFTADLTSNIRDASGNLLFNPRVIGNASATVSLGIGVNHGVAGQMAIKDALQKMQIALFETLMQKSDGSPQAATLVSAPTKIDTSIDDRLTSLKSLLDKKLISPTDFEKKKAEILKGL